MKSRRNHKWKRSALPSDRHQRACAARHIPYAGYLYRNITASKQVEEKETRSMNSVEDVKVEPLPAVKKKEQEKKAKKEKKPGALHRLNRNVQASRNAEIDALISRKHHSPVALLIHPFRCMQHEAEQELPSSLLSSIVRLLLKWIVAAVIVSLYFSALINYYDFSILRISFTSGANTAMRLCLSFAACELLAYIVITICSRVTKKPLTLARVCAAGTMGFLSEIAGLVLAGIVGIAYPLVAMALLVGVLLYGTALKGMAISKCGSLREETVAIVIGFSAMLSIGLVLLLFNLGETELLRLLLEIYY